MVIPIYHTAGALYGIVIILGALVLLCSRESPCNCRDGRYIDIIVYRDIEKIRYTYIIILSVYTQLI